MNQKVNPFFIAAAEVICFDYFNELYSEPQTVQQSQSQDQQNFVAKASSSNTDKMEKMQRIINELSAV